MKKYKVKEVVSDVFYYDLIDFNRIDPVKILVDQDKALKIKEAISLVKAFKKELTEDGILELC